MLAGGSDELGAGLTKALRLRALLASSPRCALRRLTSWWGALALLAAVRVAIPLAAYAAHGSKLPGIPRFTRIRA